MVNVNKNVSTGEDQVNKNWCCLEGESPEDHKFITVKTQVAKT